MSNLERWDERGRDSEEEEEIPSFLRPTAQSQRRTEQAKAEMMMVEQREALDRDQQVSSNFIVDQSQFRNVQVGVGYQHSSVIRQPTVRENVNDQDKTVDKTPQAVLARKEKKRQREMTESKIVEDDDKKEYKKKKEHKKDHKSSNKRDKKKKSSSKSHHKKSKHKHSKKSKKKKHDHDEECNSSSSSSSEDEDGAIKGEKAANEMAENNIGDTSQIEVDPTLALDALEKMRKELIKAISQESSRN